MGLKRGDKIAIVGDNRPRLYWTMTAAQAIGAIPVPVYQDSVAEEMSYVIEHAEVRFAMVEDQEQVDKLIEIRENCPRLERIIYDDKRGLRDYSQDFLCSFEEVQEQGRAYAGAHPEFYDARSPRAVAPIPPIMLYTSGTTGRPKGVVLSFDNVLQTAKTPPNWRV